MGVGQVRSSYHSDHIPQDSQIFCYVGDDDGDSGNFGTDVEALFQAIRARAWYKGP